MQSRRQCRPQTLSCFERRDLLQAMLVCHRQQQVLLRHQRLLRRSSQEQLRCWLQQAVPQGCLAASAWAPRRCCQAPQALPLRLALQVHLRRLTALQAEGFVLLPLLHPRL